jgi:hypothetical protein
MTVISKENNYLTFINIFTVSPANQQKLIDLLKQATEVVRAAPGFVSSSLHSGLDDTKVTMYGLSAAQANRASYNSRDNPLPRCSMPILFFSRSVDRILQRCRRQTLTITCKFENILYFLHAIFRI